MKKALLSFSVIVSMVAAVAGITYAVFSDSDTIEGHTVSTAHVNISAVGEAGSESAPKPIDADGLLPGEMTDWYRGAVHNEVDSSDVRLYMYAENLSGAACDKINLEVTTGHAGGDEHQYEVYNGTLSGLVGSGNRVEITGYVFDPTIPAHTSAVLQQRAELDSSADNTYQNTSCTWDEVFVAETP